MKKSMEKQTISRIVQARLCVMKIWYKSNSIVPPDELRACFSVCPLGILPQSFRIRNICPFAIVADEKYFYHVSKTPCIYCISLIYRLFLRLALAFRPWHIVV